MSKESATRAVRRRRPPASDDRPSTEFEQIARARPAELHELRIDAASARRPIIVPDTFNALICSGDVMGRVMRTIAVERHGSTLLFKDADGLRHAARASAILAASDADDTRDATILQLPGARFLVVRSGLDDVLPLISGPPAIAAPPPRPADEEVRRARLVVANLRVVWLRTMSALREEACCPRRPSARYGINASRQPARSRNSAGRNTIRSAPRWRTISSLFSPNSSQTTRPAVDGATPSLLGSVAAAVAETAAHGVAYYG